MRDALEPVLTLAKNLPREELPRLLGDLAEISATANARLTIHAVESRPDELLDVRATAKRLGVSCDYLYRHRGDFPFARKIGRKLLFSSSGLAKFLARKVEDLSETRRTP